MKKGVSNPTLPPSSRVTVFKLDLAALVAICLPTAVDLRCKHFPSQGKDLAVSKRAEGTYPVNAILSISM